MIGSANTFGAVISLWERHEPILWEYAHCPALSSSFTYLTRYWTRPVLPGQRHFHMQSGVPSAHKQSPASCELGVVGD